jgi:hypothetical protein
VLACNISWGQDIASELPGLIVRTAACVGHESNHVGGTLFNKTDDTVYGHYEVRVYDETSNLLLLKTEPFIAYPRQSKKFNVKLGVFRCNTLNKYAFHLVGGI